MFDIEEMLQKVGSRFLARKEFPPLSTEVSVRHFFLANAWQILSCIYALWERPKKEGKIPCGFGPALSGAEGA